MRLPEVIAKHLDWTDAKKPPIGYSPEEIIILPQGYDGKPAVLKYSNRIEVYEEGVIYAWLKGKLPVPDVYVNIEVDGIYYLIVSLASGQMLSEKALDLSKKDILIMYAKLLRRIHSLDYHDFPLKHGKAYKIAKAKETVMKNEAKIEYFERELQGQQPKALIRKIEALQDFEEDLVFCHGDVCFPNFMVDDTLNLTAVLDVSGAGINDRHLDLAIGLRTLRYNFELKNETLTQKDIQLFLETYGLKHIDMNIITFYILIDELTNG